MRRRYPDHDSVIVSSVRVGEAVDVVAVAEPAAVLSDDRASSVVENRACGEGIARDYGVDSDELAGLDVVLTGHQDPVGVADRLGCCRPVHLDTARRTPADHDGDVSTDGVAAGACCGGCGQRGEGGCGEPDRCCCCREDCGERFGVHGRLFLVWLGLGDLAGWGGVEFLLDSGSGIRAHFSNCGDDDRARFGAGVAQGAGQMLGNEPQRGSAA